MRWLSLVLVFLSACGGPKDYQVVNAPQLQVLNNSQLLVFKNQPYRVSFTWLESIKTSVKDKNKLIVYVYNSQKELVDLPEVLNLEFYASMPSMGHPMENEGVFQRVAQGIYLNQDIVFNMGGEWLMELWLINAQFEVKDQVAWIEKL